MAVRRCTGLRCAAEVISFEWFVAMRCEVTVGVAGRGGVWVEQARCGPNIKGVAEIGKV